MKVILALCGAVVLAGCSSVPIQKAENDSAFVCDYALMTRVQQRAALRADVYWINCPQIRRDRVKAVS